MGDTIEAYLAFLWQQLQYDWSWMSNPWVLYTVIPVILYFVFFFFKWVVLLAPITIPIMVFRWPSKNYKKQSEKRNNYMNN